MSENDSQRALQEVAGLRGEVTILHEGLRRVADRLEGTINARQDDRRREEDERKASRRYTLTTSITASAITLTALGLLINALT